jgi:hypothetical protein
MTLEEKANTWLSDPTVWFLQSAHLRMKKGRLPMISVAAWVLCSAMAVPNRLCASYSRLPSA